MVALIDKEDEIEEEAPEKVKRKKIQTRLANDYLYYAPLCHKINNKAGQLVPFKLNESQIYVHGLLQNELSRKGYVRAIMLKCRQWGGSTYVESRYDHKISYRKGKRAVIMTEADMSRDNLFSMVKTFHENKPKAVRPMTRASNEKALIYDTPKGSPVKGLRSRYDVKTCESKGGLGITTHFIHLSEYAFFKDASLNTVAGLLESVPSEYPAILGTEIIIESTANGVGGIFYNTWKESEQQEAEGKDPEYLRIFIPWFFHSEYRRKPSEAELEEIKRALSDDEEWLLKQELPSGAMVSCAQLKWRRWKISTLVPPVGFTKEEFFKQWYPATAEEAFIYSGKQVFPADEIRSATDECYSPLFVGDFNMHTGRFEKDAKGLVKIWEKPKPGVKYVIGCLPDGEKVLTSTGTKDIEDIGLREFLFDASGKKTKIKNIQRRYYEGEVYAIKPYCTSIATRVTSEHPILVLKDNKIKRMQGKERYYGTEVTWKDACDITIKDILRVPIKYTKTLYSCNLPKRYFPKQDSIRVDRRISPECIKAKDFWYFMGFWLAEGWIRGGGSHPLKEITVCMAKTEVSILKNIKRIIKEVFNRKPAVTNRPSTVEVKFNSEAIYKFIQDNFGQKAKNKDISEWIKRIEEPLKLSLFKGYWDGDGCTKKEKERQVINCVSISEKMLHDFQDILLSIGIMASVKLLRKEGFAVFGDRKCYTQKTYELNLSPRDSGELLELMGIGNNNKFSRSRHKRYGWIEDGFLYLKIHKIDKGWYEGYVNNFETEDHSYCTPLMTVHNCDVAEGLANGDFSSIDVLKLPFGQQVAQLHGKVDPDTLGELAYHFGMFYNKALMGIESNNHGLTTITALKKKNYPNLYQREKLDANSDGRKTKTAGWLTTKKSKYKIIDQLRAALRDGESGVCCKETLGEMRDYTIHEGDNGTCTYGAKLGCFDDRVMSLAIGLEMLYTIPKAMQARTKVIKQNTKDKKPAWANQSEIDNIKRMQRSSI